MNKYHSHRDGFTLIEMIIYIALTAIVVVALLHAMINVMSHREKTEIQSIVQQELRFTLDRIVTTALQATSVNTGSSLFNSSGGMLSFAMSGSSINPTAFFLSGSQIFSAEAGSSTGALTSTKMIVDEFHLTNRSATGAYQTIQIELHGVDFSSGSDINYADAMSLSTSVTLRQ